MKYDFSPASFLQMSEPDDNPGDVHSRYSSCSIGGSVAVMTKQFLGIWLGELSKVSLGWEQGGVVQSLVFSHLFCVKAVFDTWLCCASLE